MTRVDHMLLAAIKHAIGWVSFHFSCESNISNLAESNWKLKCKNFNKIIYFLFILQLYYKIYIICFVFEKLIIFIKHSSIYDSVLHILYLYLSNLIVKRYCSFNYNTFLIKCNYEKETTYLIVFTYCKKDPDKLNVFQDYKDI